MRGSFIAGIMAALLGMHSSAGGEGLERPQADAIEIASIGTDGVQRATVVLDSYSYNPNHLIVHVGNPVELTLTSVTTIIPHNFIVKDPQSQLSIEGDVEAGKSVKITFTPMTPGSFPIYCDKRLWPLPSHREKGMEGILEVKE